MTPNVLRHVARGRSHSLLLVFIFLIVFAVFFLFMPPVVITFPHVDAVSFGLQPHSPRDLQLKLANLRLEMFSLR